jgi:hypothetical protein
MVRQAHHEEKKGLILSLSKDEAGLASLTSETGW